MSAYYNISSKHSPDQYYSWMRNFLSLRVKNVLGVYIFMNYPPPTPSPQWFLKIWGEIMKNWKWKGKNVHLFSTLLPQKSCIFHKSARKEPKCLFNIREIKQIFSKIGVVAGVDLSEKYTPLKCWVSHTFIIMCITLFRPFQAIWYV